MNMEVAEVRMNGFRLRCPSDTQLVEGQTEPDSAGVGVGVIKTSNGPVVALLLHDSRGNRITAVLCDDEFANLYHLLIDAAEECAAGAPDAAKGRPLQ